jgi:hypothetical protein
MNKIVFLLACISALCSCSPDDIERADLSDYTIAKVVCQADHNILVADGESQLALQVRLFRNTGSTYTDKYGDEQPVYGEIPSDRWRNHDIRFFLADGTPVTTIPYKTTNYNATGFDFYAIVDGVRSTMPPEQIRQNYTTGTAADAPIPDAEVLFHVTLREAIPAYTEVTYPVIFHIAQDKTLTDRKQGIDRSIVDFFFNTWKTTLNREVDKAANGANPRIKLVLAKYDPDGNLLEENGIHRINGLTTAEIGALTDAQILSSYTWDYKRYLNVWILEGKSTVSTSNLYPKNYVAGYDASLVSPISSPVTVDANTWQPSNLYHIGVLIRSTDFIRPDLNSYTNYLGAYFGLYANAAASNITASVNDGCEDTFSYIQYYGTGGRPAAAIGSTRVKLTAGTNNPWVVFYSSNIMEASSFCTTISQDQAKRIRHALEYSPARWAYKDDWAWNPARHQ